MKKRIVFITSISIVLMCSVALYANPDQMKLYKKAYPDVSKPQCIFCHVDKVPKKADDEHDLNPYGLKAQEMSPPPTQETYKAIGRHDEFKAE